jgi:hypothetical protein
MPTVAETLSSVEGQLASASACLELLSVILPSRNLGSVGSFGDGGMCP